MAAHAIVKSPIEFALRELCLKHGFTNTVLGPALLYSNDERQKIPICQMGVYPETLGKKGASRVSDDDVGEAVKLALLDQGKQWNGKKIMLGSKKRYTVSLFDMISLK